jgi:hypothetical protein
LLASIAIGGCAPREAPEAKVSRPEPASLAPVAVATRVLEAFRAKDGLRLAAISHPDLGVRFSPYAYVDVAQDRVLDRSELETLWQDERIHTWGSFDGSGDPIQMTSAQYFDRFVMDRDFSKATVITVNSHRTSGNTADNSAEAYPRGTIVEYYVEPAGGQPEMDWAALRLVLEQHEGEWKLVGVIHDEWTI